MSSRFAAVALRMREATSGPPKVVPSDCAEVRASELRASVAPGTVDRGAVVVAGLGDVCGMVASRCVVGDVVVVGDVGCIGFAGLVFSDGCVAGGGVDEGVEGFGLLACENANGTNVAEASNAARERE
jgi:hypothetical protein